MIAYILRTKMYMYDTRKDLINAYVKPGMIGCELGVFAGEFAEYLASKHPQKLYLIDIWQGDTNNVSMSADENGNNPVFYNADELFKHVTALFKTNPAIEIRRGFTQDVIPTLPNNSLDYVYIDADHSYEGVLRDLTNILPKMKQQCWILGHDYEMNLEKANTVWKFGVKKAVDEFCKKHQFRLVAKGMDGCVSYCLERMGFEMRPTFQTFNEAAAFYKSPVNLFEHRQLYNYFHSVVMSNKQIMDALCLMRSTIDPAIIGVWKSLLSSFDNNASDCIYLESSSTDTSWLALIQMLAPNIKLHGFSLRKNLALQDLHHTFACIHSDPSSVSILEGPSQQYMLRENSVDVLHINQISDRNEIIHMMNCLKPGGYIVIQYANGCMEQQSGPTIGPAMYGKVIEDITHQKGWEEQLTVGHMRIWQKT